MCRDGSADSGDGFGGDRTSDPSKNTALNAVAQLSCSLVPNAERMISNFDSAHLKA